MLGSIVEKDVPAPTAPSLPSARPGNVGGFPQATHRSTSRFALAKATAASRGKGPAAPASSRPARAPALQTTSLNPDEAPPPHSISSKPPGSETEEARIRREVSAENDARLAAMTAEEEGDASRAISSGGIGGEFSGGCVDVGCSRSG
jgi:hypothetical protein